MESNHDNFTPPMNPRRIAGPSREIFAAMGRDAIYRMLADFYRELAGSPIRDMFAQDMQESSKRSAAFFVQSFGGPREYDELYGHPRLRGRHLRFPITEAARQIWFDCFQRILADAPSRYGFPAQHMDTFKEFLDHFSRWIVNKAEEERPGT
jgi:hemoglobin